MMREPLDLFRETVGVERLDRVDHARVQLAPALVEQAGVGDFLRQGVLERVDQLGDQAGLVEKLAVLEPLKGPPNPFLVVFDDLPKPREWDVFADDRRRLEQALVVGREPVDPRGEHCLHRCGHPQRRHGLASDRLHAVRPGRPSR